MLLALTQVSIRIIVDDGVVRLTERNRLVI